MNAWQIAKQLRYKFQSQVWPETSGQLIWGGRVICTNSMPIEEYANLGAPAILIAVNDDEADEQSPGYVRQTFTVTYWCSVPGDLRGQNALLGANRTGGAVSSSGRGILEYAEEVSRTLRQIQETLGVKIIAKRKSDVGTGIMSGLGYVAMRQTIFEAKCTDQRYYHPVLRLTNHPGDWGGLKLDWSDPPDRFDGAARYIRIRRATGSTPPASVTDGTQVADVLRGVGTVVDAAVFGVPGTYTYAAFAGYSDSGAAAVANVEERYSDLEPGMYKTVVWAGF